MARESIGTKLCETCANVVFFPRALFWFVRDELKSRKQVKRKKCGLPVQELPKQNQLKPPIWPVPYPGQNLSPVVISSLCTNPQLNFGLLKLPVELRLMIYNHVFGASDAIRIQKIVNRDELPPRHELCITRRDITEKNEHAIETQGTSIGPNLKILSLLLTCRVLYADVLNVIYTHCAFEFTDLDTIIMSSVCLPPPVFQSITTLRLCARYIAPHTNFMGTVWHFPNSYQKNLSHLPRTDSCISTFMMEKSAWLSACKVLSNMQNLRKLDIQLCHSAFADVLFANNPEKLITNEDFVFAPLVGIGINRTSLEKFEVEVDWPAGDEGWDDMDTPFTLTRVDPRMRRWPSDQPRYFYYDRVHVCRLRVS